ncbi:unnamed protein product [Acanthoscelides obtectus]|uniref:Uncharacterized protein n=1 Tax=Acanthoscelides obtectus TaxID=200917 RepID=A0A9P0K5V8_ACAOB|nr:unnamed protein product [Acanthoscelides obtectus]CAK1646689.1 hypothetical protein AOBTE_LOCUS14818 [Acanthoscelides obtectus]
MPYIILQPYHVSSGESVKKLLAKTRQDHFIPDIPRRKLHVKRLRVSTSCRVCHAPNDNESVALNTLAISVMMNNDVRDQRLRQS